MNKLITVITLALAILTIGCGSSASSKEILEECVYSANKLLTETNSPSRVVDSFINKANIVILKVGATKETYYCSVHSDVVSIRRNLSELKLLLES